MLNVVVKAVQVAVGAAVGAVASDAFDKLVVDPLKKVIEAKKGKGA